METLRHGNPPRVHHAARRRGGRMAGRRGGVTTRSPRATLRPCGKGSSNSAEDGCVVRIIGMAVADRQCA
jgi:hypothetical protein